MEISRHVIRKQLIGSYTFSIIGQADCARFVADHHVDVDKVFTDRWTLDQAVEAYADFDKQSWGKAFLAP